MHMRLAMLEDLVVPLAASVTRRPLATRNAASEPPTQARLRDDIRTLVSLYGERPDFEGQERPRRVPFIPLAYAGSMFAYFASQARRWKASSVPRPAVQPRFIDKYLGIARDVLGRVEGDVVREPNPSSIEGAPPAVEARIVKPFERLAVPRPRILVLTGPASWTFLDALQRLAIHFDALAGQPTRLQLFGEAASETLADAAEGAMDAAGELLRLPGKAVAGGRSALQWAGLAALGLGALYVVTR